MIQCSRARGHSNRRSIPNNSAAISRTAPATRRGEVLGLQWRDITWLTLKQTDDGAWTMTWAPKAEIVLGWRKSKTRKDRRIPISTRLKAVLEVRRLDPRGVPHPLDAYVFGTAIGTRILNIKRSWMATVLRAHGETPEYTATGNFTEGSRAALKRINLHFHDLRREAGSRWLDGGVPLHVIRDWLGHSNIAQTSTYLASTITTQHDAMAQYEKHVRNGCATDVGSGGIKRAPRSTKRTRKPKETPRIHETTVM